MRAPEADMIIGVDFDNTIVCYDELFYELAIDRGLIPSSLTANKTAIRNHIRKAGKEEAWIELQGYAYGKYMWKSKPFSGVKDFFQTVNRFGSPVIISHKTRFPNKGPKCDLHQTAREWLTSHGILGRTKSNIHSDQIYFNLTREEKINCIAAQGCTHFIDDLPEFLLEPGFPDNVYRMLFDPNRTHQGNHGLHTFASWKEIIDFFQQP